MTKLKVNHENYKRFEYPEFMKFGEIAHKPTKTQYEVGDVVYIKKQNSIGVVLGCIDNDCEDLRTDMEGMQCFSEIRPATLQDFQKKNVVFLSILLEELQNEK